MVFKRRVLLATLPFPPKMAAHDMWLHCLVRFILDVVIIPKSYNYIGGMKILFLLLEQKVLIAYGIR